MLRGIRQRSKNNKKTNKRKMHRGGALYTFDLNDKVGGLPAQIPLNGTADGDCPGTDTKDLGFVNYGVAKGGSRRRHSHKKTKKYSKKNNSRRSNKSYRKNRK